MKCSAKAFFEEDGYSIGWDALEFHNSDQETAYRWIKDRLLGKVLIGHSAIVEVWIKERLGAPVRFIGRYKLTAPSGSRIDVLDERTLDDT